MQRAAERGSGITARDSLQRSVHALGILSHLRPVNGTCDAAQQTAIQDSHSFQVHKQVITRLVHEMLLGPDARDHGAGFVGWLGCLAMCVWPQLAEFVPSPTMLQFQLDGGADSAQNRKACCAEDTEWLEVLHRLHVEAGTAVVIDEFSVSVAQEALSERNQALPSAFHDLLLRLFVEDSDDCGLCLAAAVHVCILLRLYDALEALVCGALQGSRTSSDRSQTVSQYQQKLKLVGFAAVHLCLHSVKAGKSDHRGLEASKSPDTASFHLIAFEAADTFISSLGSVGLGISIQARHIVPCCNRAIVYQSKPEGGKAYIEDFNFAAPLHMSEANYKQLGFLSSSLRGWWSLISMQKPCICSPSSGERLESPKDIWLPLYCFYSFLQVLLPCIFIQSIAVI